MDGFFENYETPKRHSNNQAPQSAQKIQLDAFISRLAGMCKNAINQRGGKVSVEQLATAMQIHEDAIWLGLDWLEAGGHLHVLKREDTGMFLSMGDGVVKPSLQRDLYIELKGLLLDEGNELTKSPSISSDDFFSEWLEREDANISLHVENGGYVIEHRQDVGWWVTWKSFPTYACGDLGMQSKIQRILGASDSYYGIVWGLVDVNNFCYMLINPKKQFTVGRCIDGEWQPLCPWTIAPIKPEVGSVNEIGVFIQKGFIELHINDFRVFKREWKNLILGDSIGFLVGHVMKVKVLALTISAGRSLQIPQVKAFSTVTIKRTHVASSNLKSVGYESSSKVLEIEFNNGAVYQYYGVPQQIYMELMQADSHSEYFYAFVRDKFQYQQVRNQLTNQTNYYDDDNYDEEDYDIGDLKSDLGMDFMSDSEFDDWLDDQAGGRD